MDNYKERLDKIISGKKVNDLKVAEKNEISEILKKMQNDGDINYFEYLIKFPPEVGISLFVTKLKKSDIQDQEQKINDLFLKLEIVKNINRFQIIKRELSLISILLKENIGEKIIWLTLNKTIFEIKKYSGRNLKDNVAEQIYKLLVKQSSQFLFKLIIDEKYLLKTEFQDILNIFIGTLFIGEKDLDIKPELQFELLNWFSKSSIYFKLSDEQGVSLKRNIRNKWTNGLISKIKSYDDIMEKFKPWVDDVSPNFKYDNKNESENLLPVKNSVPTAKEDVSFNNFKKQTTDPFSDLEISIKSLNSAFKRARGKINELEDYRIKITELENNISKLQNEIISANMKNTALIDEKNLLESKLKEYELKLANNKKLIQELEIKSYSNKAIIENLHKNAELEKNNLLEGYKNKITSRLKAEYLDFMSIKDKEINKDLANNLKTQIENIFIILKSNGIKF